MRPMGSSIEEESSPLSRRKPPWQHEIEATERNSFIVEFLGHPNSLSGHSGEDKQKHVIEDGIKLKDKTRACTFLFPGKACPLPVSSSLKMFAHFCPPSSKIYS